MNKEIKKGDTFLYQQKEIIMNRRLWFWIPYEVIKTTETQFTLSNNRKFKKRNLQGIAEWSTVYPIDNKKGVVSELVQLEKMRMREEIATRIENVLREIDIRYDTKITNEELLKIEKQLLNISQTINNE